MQARSKLITTTCESTLLTAITSLSATKGDRPHSSEEEVIVTETSSSLLLEEQQDALLYQMATEFPHGELTRMIIGASLTLFY